MADGTERSAKDIASNVVGWVEWTLRNEDGSVAAKGEQHNIFTRRGRRNLPSTGALPQFVVLMDDEHPAGVKEGLSTFKVDQTTPTQQQNFAPVVTGFVRTMSGSFSQPAVARIIRRIGLGGNGGTGGDITEGCVRHIHAYLELNPVVVQATNQTFEISYRLALVPNTAKTLRRWQTWGPNEEAYVADDLVNGGWASYTPSIGPFVCGSRFFHDQGAAYRGNGNVAGAGLWQTAPTLTIIDGALQRAGGEVTRLVTDVNNNTIVGAFGMMMSPPSAINGNAPEHIQTSANRAVGYFPLAAYEGTISNVFKHVAGEIYLFNVVASVALSQGNVEVRGPYIPDEDRAPWHWGYQVVIQDSGDTDGGTEGTYCLRRFGYVGYPYPGFLAAEDIVNNPAVYISNMITAPSGAFVAASKHSIAFDGEFYWGAIFSTGTAARVFRWRAGSNEQVFDDVVGDTTRFFGFQPVAAANGAYHVASDEAGTVWVLESSAVLANQRLYRIDNTTPGRHYQRPSGVVLTGNPQTFTVDTEDEIHAMFPFVLGDVGRQIRIVNTANNGASSVRTITAYNGPNSVDVDGTAFVTEGGMTWHWVTVETVSTNQWPAQCSWLAYDKANGRLWSASTAGLHFSLDDGATWTTIDETNGLSTALAKAVRVGDGQDAWQTIVVGNGGKLYWVDTNNAVNKYTPVPVTIVSGTHERVTSAALPSFPNSYTKGTILSIGYQGTAPDMNEDGALWIGQDRVAARGFWRMACGPTFVAGGATGYSDQSSGGSGTGFLQLGAQHFICTPCGRVYLGNRTGGIQWREAYCDEATGVLTFVNRGNILGIAGQWIGAVLVRPNGLTCNFGSASGGIPARTTAGSFHGISVQYRYNDLTGDWIPWHGSAAQFNARFGTTNGGKRDCHASWEPVLRGAQPNNLELRFVQAGGGVAPADEFRTGELFAWAAAFGVLRTNVQDLTWRADTSFAGVEPKVEVEAIKTVTGRGSIRVYYTRAAGVASPTPVPLGASAYPTNIPPLDNAGINFGWMPSRQTYLVGGGDLADTATGFGPTSFSQHFIGIDLGAGPPAISKLRFVTYGSNEFYMWHRYHRTSGDRGRMRVFYSDDNAVWTEATAVRFQLNGAAQPDAGYRYVYVEDFTYGGSNGNTLENMITFDLEAAGMSSLDRTHRYWQIHAGSESGANYNTPRFGGVHALDSNFNPIGFTTNHRTDEAHDSDHGASWLWAVDFIQTRTGLSGQGGIDTVDDGDGDGRTNVVTIDAGSFDTGVISTVTDFLAWRESPGVGNGYVRRPHGEAGRAHPWQLGFQARSRIIATSPTTITVADDIIPDNLAAVDFEIRRPAVGTGSTLSAGSFPLHDVMSGYMQFHDSDIGREYRITRKAIIRLP